MPIYVNSLPTEALTRFARTDKYMGDPNTPGDIRRRRRSVYDMMRRMGTPVLVKHRFSEEDVRKGIAKKSAAYDDVYGQSRDHDSLSWGVGYMSLALSPDEWYDSNGNIVTSFTNPGSGYTRAPLYRGFGPGILTYIIEPDRAQDYFQANTGGPLIKVQESLAVAPWYPKIRDGDLIIDVTIDGQGNILSSEERFEAKKTTPITMRGRDRRGSEEHADFDGGNRFTINQTFEMAKLPYNDIKQQVEIDR